MPQLTITPGRILLWSSGLFLALAVFSADFRDPSFFNQLYPAEGIRNWCSLPGALLGGTLIELLGPPAILAPWLLVRIPLQRDPNRSGWVLWYYALVLMLMLTTLREFAWPGSEFDPASQRFFWKQGYLGQLAGNWLNSSVGPEAGLFMVLCALGLSCWRLATVLSPVGVLWTMLLIFIGIPRSLARWLRGKTTARHYPRTLQEGPPVFFQNRGKTGREPGDQSVNENPDPESGTKLK